MRDPILVGAILTPFVSIIGVGVWLAHLIEAAWGRPGLVFVGTFAVLSLITLMMLVLGGALWIWARKGKS